MLKYQPVILLLMIVLLILFGSFIPISVTRLLFTISLFIKSIILFILPIVIFGILFNSVSKSVVNVSRIIIYLILGVMASNFITTIISYFLGQLIYTQKFTLITPNNLEQLKPYYFLSLPTLIPNHVAMISAVIISLFTIKFIPKKRAQISLIIEYIVNKLLKIINMVIPIFVVGFFLKFQYDGIINQIIKDYTKIFIFIVFVQYSYCMFLYFIFFNFNIKATCSAIKNMFPAIISAFTTMSSVITMPITILATTKNLGNKNFSSTVITSTVNIHLIGDCIAIPCLAFAIMKSNSLDYPLISTYFIFAINFILTKFSVAAIPGGGIIIMLPVLKDYLGFNYDMLSLITALYILFDPIITSVNVMGNGVFAKAIQSKLYNAQQSYK